VPNKNVHAQVTTVPRMDNEGSEPVISLSQWRQNLTKSGGLEGRLLMSKSPVLNSMPLQAFQGEKAGAAFISAVIMQVFGVFGLIRLSVAVIHRF